MSKKTIEGMWQEYRETGSLDARNELVVHYRELARYYAERIRLLPGFFLEIDDLISAGTFGLMDAISSFDPDRGVKFETYSFHRIKGAMLDEMRRTDNLSRLSRERIEKYKIARTRLNKQGSLTSEEVSQVLKVSPKEARSILFTVGIVPIQKIPLGDKSRDEESDCIAFDFSYLEDTSLKGPLQQLVEEDNFNNLISCLNRIHRVIMTMYFREGREMKEIGETLGYCESRISQIISSCCKIIKSELTRKKSDERDR